MALSPIVHQADPKLDLVLERIVDVPCHFLWRGWTEPELLKQWFCPKPWQTVECEIDLRPGGLFRNVMRGPDGTEMANTGTYLEVVEDRKLVWTGALGPGFRPQPNPPAPPHPFVMSAVIALEALGPEQTRYTAIAIHGDEAARQMHEQMGFHVGWGLALDQLVALAKG